MKRVRFHSEAGAELFEAAGFLHAISPRYAEAFLNEVERALQQIEQFPAIGGRTLGASRRWLLRRYPFELIYRESGDGIFVLAVAHSGRAPGYWLGRADEGEEVHEPMQVVASER